MTIKKLNTNSVKLDLLDDPPFSSEYRDYNRLEEYRIWDTIIENFENFSDCMLGTFRRVINDN